MTEKLDWKKFIKFWLQFYDDRKYKEKKFYYPYIEDLSKNDSLGKLWRWKMQEKFFTPHNQRALEQMKANIEIILDFRKSNPSFQELYNFSRRIFKSGVVYPVFLIHVCKPEDYPIFDQHVFRAFIFLITGKITDKPKEIKDYLNYRKFVFKIHKQHNINLRDIDKALMAFGQFLDKPQKFLKITKI